MIKSERERNLAGCKIWELSKINHTVVDDLTCQPSKASILIQWQVGKVVVVVVVGSIEVLKLS
jgi:hypothetical protein